MAVYAYDALGRRAERLVRNVPGGNHAYTYDGQDILREGNGGPIDALKAIHLHGSGIDEPLESVNSSGQVTFLHADGLGSIVRGTNSAAAVSLSRQYNAFGNPELGGTQEGYAFTGREWDPETGLYYYRARYYDPKIGRFISEDPIQFDGDGTNFYAYVKANPVRWRDPSGRKIQVCNRNADLGPIPGNHSYLYNPETGENCGRGSQSGKENPGKDPGTRCIDVPDSDGRERQILDCCEVQKRNAGLFAPPINDCHQLVHDALKCGGVDNPPSAPGGRLGCPTCPGGRRPDRPPLPRR